MALVNEILERDQDTTLTAYLSYRRDNGDSFDTIARQLSSLIDVSGFTVTYQTVRRWCRRLGVEVSA